MSEIWTPHATVACIVEQDQKFLMVEENSNGERVFNQPAGHIDEDESIFEAAIRETVEETGWQVELTALTGLYTYLAPQNGVCYHRYCFLAKPLKRITEQLDDDIIAAHWLSYEELLERQDQLRSPLVLKCIDDALHRKALPLDYIYECTP